MAVQQNVNSPAKAISDNQLTYDRLIRIRADIVEIIRLDQLTTEPPDDESLATIDAWIQDMRAVIKFGS